MKNGDLEDHWMQDKPARKKRAIVIPHNCASPPKPMIPAIINIDSPSRMMDMHIKRVGPFKSPTNLSRHISLNRLRIIEQKQQLDNKIKQFASKFLDVQEP